METERTGRGAQRPMNGSKPGARDLIAQIMDSERFQRSSHFSDRVYADEPIIKTGRQMATYLPERYREMRAISRWQEGTSGAHGRWLSEAELFYRQGIFMADYEDDCPYHGMFKSYYPTYNAMSDKQLRGYFTWRAAVRAGRIEETSLSFAYVYLYELICGIGVENAQDGYTRIRSFWEAYRAFAPEIDRYARVWLQDYVVYHGLDPKLLDGQKTVAFDRAILALRHAEAAARQLSEGAAQMRGGKRKGKAPSSIFAPNADIERTLLSAVDELSTYRIQGARFFSVCPEGLAHVACATFVRLCGHYARSRKNGLVESLFGMESTLPYTMFGSAVFFDPMRHADVEYELDPVHSYRCERGLWSCTRVHGSRQRSSKLGSAMRAVDRKMREAYGYAHPLKAEEIPKYLDAMIDTEIAAWRAFEREREERTVRVDLSKLSGIRSAAAQTREALLIDEERDEASGGSLLERTMEGEPSDTAASAVERSAEPFDKGHPGRHQTKPHAAADGIAPEQGDADSPVKTSAQDIAADHGVLPSPREGGISPADSRVTQAAEDGTQCADATGPRVEAPSPPDSGDAVGLSAPYVSYLRALLERDEAERADAAQVAGVSEDLLVDAINERFFDLVGDTVIEFGANGPELIEDYRDDVKDVIDRG